MLVSDTLHVFELSIVLVVRWYEMKIKPNLQFLAVSHLVYATLSLQDSNPSAFPTLCLQTMAVLKVEKCFAFPLQPLAVALHPVTVHDAIKNSRRNQLSVQPFPPTLHPPRRKVVPCSGLLPSSVQPPHILILG